MSITLIRYVNICTVAVHVYCTTVSQAHIHTSRCIQYVIIMPWVQNNIFIIQMYTICWFLCMYMYLYIYMIVSHGYMGLTLPGKVIMQ